MHSGCFPGVGKPSDCCNENMNGMNDDYRADKRDGTMQYDDAAHGGASHDGAPYDGNPYGDPSYGGTPHNNAPYNNAPYSNAPYGNAPYGNAPKETWLQRLFRRIRESGLRRTDDRRIGGVCDGIAQRLGWSAVLVRSLMVASVLLFGAGAAFYGLAWMLLPDSRNGHILAQDLIDGQWDWSMIGVFLCLACALLIPGAGWLAFALAAALLWYLVRVSSRAAWQYAQRPMDAAVPPYSAATAYSPAVPSEDASSMNMPPMDVPPTNTMRPTRQSEQPVPPGRPVSPVQSVPPAQSVPSIQAATQQPMLGGMPMTSVYRAPQETPRPKRVRRKPAGPLIVLIASGLMLVSVGAIALGLDGTDSIAEDLQRICIWSGIICAALGVLIVGLGAFGRRAGGLHPLAWCAAFIAAGMLFVSMGYAYSLNEVRSGIGDYSRVEVDDLRVYGSSSEQMQEYTQGMAFLGDDYDDSIVHIDLTDYAHNNGTHSGRLNDGSAVDSACPAGTLNLYAEESRVYITLPDGCGWTFNNGWVGDGIYGYGRHSFIGPYGGGVSLSLPFDWESSTEISAQDVCDTVDYEVVSSDDIPSDSYWPCRAAAPESAVPDLNINVRGVADAKIIVQYESQNTLPSADGSAVGYGIYHKESDHE